MSGPAMRKVDSAKGRTCSLMPLSTCKGVTLEGFRWPLEHATLAPGERFACSNVIIEQSARVDLQQGLLFLYLHHGTTV